MKSSRECLAREPVHRSFNSRVPIKGDLPSVQAVDGSLSEHEALENGSVAVLGTANSVCRDRLLNDRPSNDSEVGVLFLWPALE